MWLGGGVDLSNCAINISLFIYTLQNVVALQRLFSEQSDDNNKIKRWKSSVFLLYTVILYKLNVKSMII